MEEALRVHYNRGVRKVAFGDIFLEDLRVYREKNLARIGMTALFPIWKRDTRELIRLFYAQRFRAIAVCVDPKVLDRRFAGRELDESSSRICRPASIPAAKTANFTLLFLTGQSSVLPFPFERETSLIEIHL